MLKKKLWQKPRLKQQLKLNKYSPNVLIESFEMPQAQNKNLLNYLKSVKVTDLFLVVLLLAAFGLQLYFLYFGYKTYHYLVPPGSDAIAHYNIIQKILETGKVDFLSYPPLFHLLVIFFSKITTVSPFDILTYWTPVLAVLPAAAMFFLLKQLFDLKTSVLTTIVFLLASSYPLYGFIDGNYPDILAYGVFSILMFAFVIRYFRTKNWTNLVIASVFLLSIALTHHLTFVSMIIIMGLFGLVQIYTLVVEKKLKFDIRSWQFLSGAIAVILVGLSIYLSFRFYGPTIVKFANGFFNNNPALQDKYLNLLPQWADYSLLAGNTIWYLGVFGLLFVLISTFKDHKEAGAKQLLIVWLLYYFFISRIDNTGLPARFARELAPALVICIGFLFNYIFNLNSLRVHRYKLIFGYGLIAFLVVTNSAINAGPAKIPDSFNLMVWFTPRDQQNIDYVSSLSSEGYQVLYNPFANLYMPIKAPNNFDPIKLNNAQLKIATKMQQDKSDYYDSFIPLSAKRRTQLKGYEKLIYDLSKQYSDYKYIYVGVKPSSNPDPKVYPKYAPFEVYNKVLDDLATNGDLVKKFPDGSRLIKMY